MVYQETIYNEPFKKICLDNKYLEIRFLVDFFLKYNFKWGIKALTLKKEEKSSKAKYFIKKERKEQQNLIVCFQLRKDNGSPFCRLNNLIDIISQYNMSLNYLVITIVIE